MYKSKENQTDTFEKEKNNKANVWKPSLAKVKEIKPSWKTWLYNWKYIVVLSGNTFSSLCQSISKRL